MKYDEKVSSALAYLESLGFAPHSCAPPLHRLVWRFGLRVAPPHFASFAANLIWMAAAIGITFGLVMYFLPWFGEEESASSIIRKSASVGVVLGLLTASHYKYESKRIRLPRWKEFGEGTMPSDKAMQSDTESPRR